LIVRQTNNYSDLINQNDVLSGISKQKEASLVFLWTTLKMNLAKRLTGCEKLFLFNFLWLNGPDV
jgi:hypothetical protein